MYAAPDFGSDSEQEGLKVSGDLRGREGSLVAAGQTNHPELYNQQKDIKVNSLLNRKWCGSLCWS